MIIGVEELLTRKVMMTHLLPIQLGVIVSVAAEQRQATSVNLRQRLSRATVPRDDVSSKVRADDAVGGANETFYWLRESSHVETRLVTQYFLVPRLCNN